MQEIQNPELDAQLISESVALQLEKRVAFRRAMRKAVESALRFGARGIKIRVGGRLYGAEIAIGHLQYNVGMRFVTDPWCPYSVLSVCVFAVTRRHFML